MSLLRQIYIADALAATTGSILLLDHDGKRLATELDPSQAAKIIATGLVLVGGSRQRVKYLRLKVAAMPIEEVKPVTATPYCPLRAPRRQYHEWHQQRAILPPSADWLARHGYELTFGRPNCRALAMAAAREAS